MSSSARAVAGVLLLLLTAASPLVTTASANETVLLSVDPQHAVLAPGESLNLTLTVNNNGSSIRDYNLTVDDASLDAVWDVIPVANAVNNVFPTWSKNTTVVLKRVDVLFFSSISSLFRFSIWLISCCKSSGSSSMLSSAIHPYAPVRENIRPVNSLLS